MAMTTKRARTLCSRPLQVMCNSGKDNVCIYIHTSRFKVHKDVHMYVNHTFNDVCIHAFMSYEYILKYTIADSKHTYVQYIYIDYYTYIHTYVYISICQLYCRQ